MNANLKYKNLIKDTLIFALGNIGSKMITFFLVPFYTNYLTKAEYGTADLVFTVSQMLIPFASLVIFDGVIRYGLFRKERPQDALLVGLLVWALGSIFLIICCPLIGLYKSIFKWRWFVVGYASANILASIELNCSK